MRHCSRSISAACLVQGLGIAAAAAVLPSMAGEAADTHDEFVETITAAPYVLSLFQVPYTNITFCILHASSLYVTPPPH